MNNKNKGKVFYGNDCCEVRACSHINISKSELTEFVRLLQALGQAIQAVFQNPSQNNIDNLINVLNNLQRFLNCLDLSPAQKQIANSIIANLLTILRTTPFSCGALYVELQSLLNYLLYIAKLFKIDCCAIDNLVKLISEIQAILVQYGSGCLGGGTTGATGATGATGPQGAQGTSRCYWCYRRYWTSRSGWCSRRYWGSRTSRCSGTSRCSRGYWTSRCSRYSRASRRYWCSRCSRRSRASRRYWGYWTSRCSRYSRASRRYWGYWTSRC
ncbi:collagen-like repeat preface domain-containing protein, partial [Bacillus thuringiensis]|nr:collagen-like repeat preface domain-containing protein [Bacillus thuringiensis]